MPGQADVLRLVFLHLDCAVTCLQQMQLQNETQVPMESNRDIVHLVNNHVFDDYKVFVKRVWIDLFYKPPLQRTQTHRSTMSAKTAFPQMLLKWIIMIVCRGGHAVFIWKTLKNISDGCVSDIPQLSLTFCCQTLDAGVLFPSVCHSSKLQTDVPQEYFRSPRHRVSASLGP